MHEGLGELLPQMDAVHPLARSDFQALVDTGCFTVNNLLLRFDEDRWNLSESIKPELRNGISVSLDFSKVADEDIKLKVKLWAYSLINPYKKSGAIKQKTIRNKLASLIKLYAFMEADGHGFSFASPNVNDAKDLREYLKGIYKYRNQFTVCMSYISFLEFVEEVWKIPQDRDSMDVLRDFDRKKLKAEIKASITDAIPYDYFLRLYDFCKKCMFDETLDLSYRITGATIVLFSQTGLRRNELLGLEAQPVKKSTETDASGKVIEKKYIYANITKSVRGKDTKVLRKNIPLTEDGEAAFNMLMELCEEKREELEWDKLIAYPTRRSKSINRNISYETAVIRFLARFSRELDNINTQYKYPTLARRKVSQFKGEVFEDIRKEYGDDAVIVFPTSTHFRKTFGTTLSMNGVPVEVIADLLHHYSARLTEAFYIRPFYNQKDFAKSKETYASIIKHDATVLGKTAPEFKKRLEECMEEENLASICQSDEEVIEYMSNNHPLHAKEVGFCLLSDIHPCTVRTDEERLLCAFNTCPNIGFLFYDLAEHYKQMESHRKAMELNRQQGFELAAQKEANCMKYLVKSFLMPEIEETKREIQKHGKEQIIEWYPAMKSILDAFEDIEAEVTAFAKEVVA